MINWYRYKHYALIVSALDSGEIGPSPSLRTLCCVLVQDT